MPGRAGTIIMVDIICRLLKRIFKSLLSDYGPAILTILFALVLFYFFPNGPLWPVPVFFILVLIFVKW